MTKKIYDPIHKFIALDPWEVKLIRTLPFKRLQAIHQIGSASFVYGGGDHKRFDHSIGAMFVVSKIFDQVTNAESLENFPSIDLKKLPYWRKVLRAAALCHDLGHPPFSHLAEIPLLGEHGHELWTLKIIRSHYLTPIWEIAGITPEDVAKVAVGEKMYGKPMTAWENLVSEILTGDFFGGDRIDYLLRDAYFTGLAYGHFDYLQLIDSLRILPFNQCMVLGVEEDGLESCYSLLLARYFMHKRLYQNPNVKSYSYHLKTFILHFFKDQPYLDSVDNYLRINDFEILKEINTALFDKDHPMHEHAMAIMDQEHRVSVFSMSKTEYDALKEGLKLEEGIIHFENNQVSKTKQGLRFPVLMKNDIVVPAHDVSEVSIPVNFNNWVYIRPDKVNEIIRKLDHDPTVSL